MGAGVDVELVRMQLGSLEVDRNRCDKNGFRVEMVYSGLRPHVKAHLGRQMGKHHGGRSDWYAHVAGVALTLSTRG